MSTVDNEKPPYIVFEVRSQEDRAESIAKGHYVAKDLIFAVVTRPGSRDSLDVEAETYAKNLRRQAQGGIVPMAWADAYDKALAAYKANEALPESGTPIKGWPVLSPSAQQTVIRAGFRTVEDLAASPDVELQAVGMGAISWREKARNWLAEAEKAGVSVEKIADLSQKITDLTQLTERLLNENKELRAKLPQDAPKLATVKG